MGFFSALGGAVAPLLPGGMSGGSKKPPADTSPKTLGAAAQGALNTQQNGPAPFFDNPDPVPGTFNTPAPAPNYGTPYQAPAAQQPSWMDLTHPGAAENVDLAWFNQPTNSDAALKTYSPLFQDMSQTAGPTYSAQAYHDFQNTPQSAGLDPYYKNAWDETSARLNRALAARGQFNSSFGTDTVRRAAVGMGAEQANREADYGLRRSQIGGDLASRASGESLSGRESQLSAARSGAALAGDADSADLAKRGAGVGAASVVQSAHEGRIGDAADRITGNANNQVATLLPAMLANIQAHAELQGMPFELQMALAQAQMQGDQAQANNILSLAGIGGNLLGGGGK